jgi:hypothetical protein
MKTPFVLAMLGAVLSAPARAQDAAQSSSMVVLQGLIGRAPDAWLLAMPNPRRIGARPLAELELTGDSTRWTKYAGRYVEARGVIAADSVAGHDRRGRLTVSAVREVDPAGTVRRTISNSWTHRVAATLWVLPQKFAWEDERGRPTGVGPTIVYTLNNHGESDVTLQFGSRDFACISVEPKEGGAPPWKYVRQLDQANPRPVVILPKFVREHTALPREAAPSPGRYIVRASLCGYKEYELETEIEVQR